MKPIAFTFAVAALLAGGITSAVATAGATAPKPVLLHPTKATRLSLRLAFAASHHVASRRVVGPSGVLRYARFGTSEYALANLAIKGSHRITPAMLPEAFVRSSRRGRWHDTGATFGKPCRKLPAAVAAAFGYGRVCGRAPSIPPTTPTTTTDPTLPTGPPSPQPPAPTAGASADVALVSIGGAAPDGSGCDVSYTVHNNGPALNQYLTNRITITMPAGKSVSTTQGMRTMLGGEQMGLTATVPTDCSTSGTYTLTVELDYDNQLPESNEQNNIGQTTSNPTTTAYPDLVIVAAGVSNCDTAWITVKNQGNGASPAEPVDLLLRIYNSAGQFAGGQQFDSPALGPGESQTLSMAYKGDCSGLVITGDADSFSKITESNESNNYWSNQG